MGLFSQHSAAEPPSVDEFAEFAAADTPDSGVGLLDTLADSFERLIEDEPQVTSVLSSGDFDDIEADEDDPADPLGADRTSAGISSLLAQLFGKSGRSVEIDVEEAPDTVEADSSIDEIPHRDVESALSDSGDSPVADLPDVESPVDRPRRWWQRSRQTTAPDHEIESSLEDDEVDVEGLRIDAEPSNDELEDLTVEVEDITIVAEAADDLDVTSTPTVDAPDEERPRRRRRGRWGRSSTDARSDGTEELRANDESPTVDDVERTAEPIVETTDERREHSDRADDELGAFGAVAALAQLVEDDPAPSFERDSGEGDGRGDDRGRRRWWQRSRSEKAEKTVDEEPAFVEFAEPEPEPEIAVGMLTDEDLGLAEPPELSRKERKAMRKAEPRGRRARKKANEQADLDLGSRVMALATTVPDGVKTLDYPKLYQNDDLLQMGLVARRRELAALHPKEDLDTLTAASVLGSVLRMDEELYSLKPRYILRKIVLLVVAAGGAWFVADKVKKQKEAEREAEAIAHLDKQFGDGPRPPIPD